ncbi:MAG: lipopolysaccharide kinase InaA family protein [Pseudomonadota bacterium]
MSQSYWLSPDANHAERDAFASLESAAAIRGTLINESKLSHLTRVEVSGKRYYVKVYHYAGRNLRRFVGRSRVRSEWRNQRRFGDFGIPSARIVAFGEKSGLPGNRQGVIVTEEVPDSIDLFELARSEPARLADRRWVNLVIDRLARHVRSMHSHRFVHNDLKWRNILVDFSKCPEVYIIDCPLGRTLFGPLLHRGITKDLACLDRVAKRLLSRSQRLRFFKSYHQTDKLTDEQRQQMKQILRFFDGREQG